MKKILSAFDLKRNLYFRKLMLDGDYKQNVYDLKHRNNYDLYVYKLIDSESGRKLYFKNFVIFK